MFALAHIKGSRRSTNLAAVIATLKVWRMRRRSRIALAQLDERALKDIGLTMEAATREATRPFWKH